MHLFNLILTAPLLVKRISKIRAVGKGCARADAAAYTLCLLLLEQYLYTRDVRLLLTYHIQHICKLPSYIY